MSTTAPRRSRRRAAMALIAALLATAMLMLTGCTTGVAVIRDNSASQGGGGAGSLNASALPAEFVGPLTEFSSTCEGLSAPLLAAQIKAESNFQKGAVSPAGAMGYTQFMPGTWAAYGDGGDPNNPRDAVKAQAKYDCAMLKIASDRGCSGDDAIKVMLAMYNAGPGGVSGCVVPINGETEIYVPRILGYVEQFTGTDGGLANNAETGGPSGPFRYDPSKTPGQNVVLAATAQIGLDYAWGGGTLTGPSKGIHDSVADQYGDYNKTGFDCSGLSRYAIYQGSQGKVTIERYTGNQRTGGTSVPLNQLQAGDLIVWPEHVAIARGDGKTMIEAAQSGTKIKISPLRTDGALGRRYVGATQQNAA